MRRDRIANEKIIQFYVPLYRTAGTFASGVYDLRQGGSGEGPGREVPTNCMLVFVFGAGGAGNTLTTTISTGDVAGTLTSYVTLSAATKGTSDLWLAEFRDLQRYIQLSIVVAGGNTHFGVIGSFNRSRREPVIQSGVELSVTYNKSPATG